ncbi:uncharacterized protein [Haliotis cracherodii]|uniref:uncharacterized protein n=1 Tax=Haliotis cracherodii TaxID=6455 RepID=UPI0039E9300E
MFGRHPRLPEDLAFGLDIETQGTKSTTEYTKSLKDRLRQAYELATTAAMKSQSKHKIGYDHKARAAMLETGDRALVKIVAFEGRHKLADKWEEDVYVVLRRPNPSIPVFEVGKENGEGRKRILHRNLLLPVGSMPSLGVPIPKPRRQRTLPVSPVARTTESNDDVSLDEDTVVEYAHPPQALVSTDIPVDGPTEEEPSEIVSEGDGTPIAEGEEEPTEDAVQHVEQIREEDGATGADHDDDNDNEEREQQPTQEITTPVPRPRQSTRTRTQPKWMKSGEFALSAVADRDWRTRANYLSSLQADGLFREQQHRISDAILDLVTGKVK